MVLSGLENGGAVRSVNGDTASSERPAIVSQFSVDVFAELFQELQHEEDRGVSVLPGDTGTPGARSYSIIA